MSDKIVELEICGKLVKSYLMANLVKILKNNNFKFKVIKGVDYHNYLDSQSEYINYDLWKIEVFSNFEFPSKLENTIIISSGVEAGELEEIVNVFLPLEVEGNDEKIIIKDICFFQDYLEKADKIINRFESRIFPEFLVHDK